MGGSWEIELGGRRVRVTEVFWSYWRLAAERQAIFFRRVSGEASPWTDDPVLGRYRFTNAYRASDRVRGCADRRVMWGSTGLASR
ncbi:MAG: putative DNA base hypermodification protein, partial [bacterium]|nr:putative DNA base hypermodification protein [bacterium]